jgi:glycosyltransferase involved in cell wall biosynthesis
LITGSTVLARLARLPDGSPDVVIAYHPSSILLLRLQAWCRSHGAVLIADCTEWHSAARISGGRYGFFRWDNDVRMGWLHTRVGRLITISRWLAAHYAQQGCTTLCVPPLVDLDDAKCQVKRPAVATPERPLHLVFSGSPDRERLDLIMEGLHLLRADGHQVAISFVGSTRESAVRILGDRAALLDGLDTCLTFHGRVPVEHVQALLAEADFGLLFRYRERATEACFPTKVPEFLALGVPLICNVTTDVGVYLKDGASALFIPEDSATAFAATVARACALAPEVHQAMRAAASRCAATCFDYRAYAAMLHAFVNAQIAPTGTAVPPSGVPLP